LAREFISFTTARVALELSCGCWLLGNMLLIMQILQWQRAVGF
jgi:hypothetical protein